MRNAILKHLSTWMECLYLCYMMLNKTELLQHEIQLELIRCTWAKAKQRQSDGTSQVNSSVLSKNASPAGHVYDSETGKLTRYFEHT